MTTRKASTMTNYCKKHETVSRWKVQSDSGCSYTIVADEGKSNDRRFPGLQFKCSCPGWTMHVPRRDCKHIRHVKECCCN